MEDQQLFRNLPGLQVGTSEASDSTAGATLGFSASPVCKWTLVDDLFSGTWGTGRAVASAVHNPVTGSCCERSLQLNLQKGLLTVCLKVFKPTAQDTVSLVLWKSATDCQLDLWAWASILHLKEVTISTDLWCKYTMTSSLILPKNRKFPKIRMQLNRLGRLWMDTRIPWDFCAGQCAASHPCCDVTISQLLYFVPTASN